MTQSTPHLILSLYVQGDSARASGVCPPPLCVRTPGCVSSPTRRLTVAVQRGGGVPGVRWPHCAAPRGTGRGPVAGTESVGMTDRPGSTTAPVTSGGKVTEK